MRFPAYVLYIFNNNDAFERLAHTAFLWHISFAAVWRPRTQVIASPNTKGRIWDSIAH